MRPGRWRARHAPTLSSHLAPVGVALAGRAVRALESASATRRQAGGAHGPGRPSARVAARRGASLREGARQLPPRPPHVGVHAVPARPRLPHRRQPVLARIHQQVPQGHAVPQAAVQTHVVALQVCIENDLLTCFKAVGTWRVVPRHHFPPASPGADARAGAPPPPPRRPPERHGAAGAPGLHVRLPH